MEKRDVFMVSLNSKRLEVYIEKQQQSFSDKNKLDVFVYDVFEVLNGLFFSPNNIEQINEQMESIINKVNQQIVLKDVNKNKLIRFSDFQKEMSIYLIAVYSEYFTNASFKRHCKSQIFQNLQPKLREVKITDHKSNLIEILSPFLLAEIAYYLCIFHKNEYCAVYGLENEMEIITAIKNKKYERFNEFILNPVPHIKVEF